MQYFLYTRDTNPILNIILFGHASDPAETQWHGTHNRYAIHFVTSGKGIFNGKTIHAGQGFIVYPETLDKYYADPENPWSYLWLCCKDEKILELLSIYNPDPKTTIFEYNHITDVQNIEKYIIANNNTIVPSLKLLEYLLQFLNKQISSKPDMNFPKNYIHFFTNYVDSNIQSALTIAEITSILGITQHYLHRICLKHLGIPPKQYISERKLYHAKKLLKETDMPIAKIAHTIGFDDPFVFTRFFTKNIGIPPTAYRNKTKNMS